MASAAVSVSASMPRYHTGHGLVTHADARAVTRRKSPAPRPNTEGNDRMALPVSPDPTDRRAAVLRMLEESPDGLTDAALAGQLGDGVRPQTVNQLCRRLVAEGVLERVGTRPILNRLPAPKPRRGRRPASSKNGTAAPAVSEPTSGATATSPKRRTRTKTETDPAPEVVLSPPDASETGASAETEPAPVAAAPPKRRTRTKTEAPPAPEAVLSPQDASETEASVATDPPPGAAPKRRTRKKAEATPDPAPEAVLSPQDASEAEASVETGPAAPVEPVTMQEAARSDGGVSANGQGSAPVADEPVEGSASFGPPPYDALQAWSRVVNVQSLVADWLVRRGATLRWASADGNGPARDLIASLDGDDVHVEVTGWPSDGARTHPTTIAGDWFSAAEHAATERRRAHPRARIVIALPDTRRYRSLTEQRAASLDGARAEVWFVDPAGAVHAR
ncbi:hypothetical protein [Actinomycetospora succinea]|nr:hypothetical protein [Actinomycetospora succinea]